MRFIEALREKFYQNSGNVYALSKKSNVERSSLQYIIKNGRIPQKVETVQKICDGLNLTNSERNEIINLYEIEKIGDKHYQSRAYIKKMIEELTELNLFVPTANINSDVTPLFTQDYEMKIYNGNYNVTYFINQLLSSQVTSGVKINMFVPFTFQALFNLLKPIFMHFQGEIDINHIVIFEKNASDPIRNLKIMSHLLPFSFTVKGGYSARCFLSDTNFIADMSIITPYYLTIGDNLILISSDFQTVIHCKNKDIIDLYNKKFRDNFKIAKSIVQDLSNENQEYIQQIRSLCCTSDMVKYILTWDPSITQFITNEILNDRIASDIYRRDEFIHSASKMHEAFFGHLEEHNVIFTVDGMMNFAKTGNLSYIPQKYFNPVTKEQRLYFLNSIKNTVISKNKNRKFFVLNPNKFVLPKGITIQVYESYSLSFNCSTHNKYSSAFFNHPDLSLLFQDFFDSLPTSDLVYSQNELILLIDDCINIVNELPE